MKLRCSPIVAFVCAASVLCNSVFGAWEITYPEDGDTFPGGTIVDGWTMPVTLTGTGDDMVQLRIKVTKVGMAAITMRSEATTCAGTTWTNEVDPADAPPFAWTLGDNYVFNMERNLDGEFAFIGEGVTLKPI